MSATFAAGDTAAAMRELGCSLEEPRGGGRSGAGLFCRTHHEHALFITPGVAVCPKGPRRRCLWSRALLWSQPRPHRERRPVRLPARRRYPHGPGRSPMSAAADLRAELARLDALDARLSGPASLQILTTLEAGRQARVVRRAEILALLGEEDS